MSSTSRLRSRLAALRERHPQLGKIAANVSWLTGDRLLRMGAGVFVGAWVARYLGPERFGAFNYALALVALVGVLAALGVDNIAKRELLRRPAERATLLGTAFWLKLAAGFLTYLLGGIALWLVGEPSASRDTLLVVGLSLLVQPLVTTDLFFQAELKSRKSVVASNAAFGLSTLLRIGLVLAGADLVAFAAVAVLEVAVTGAILAVFYHGECADFRHWRFSGPVARMLVQQGFPLLLSGFAVIVYMRIDQVMLQAMLGEASVGIYSAALRLTEIWYFVPGVLATALFPSILRSRDSVAGDYARKMQHYFDLSAGVAYLIALPGSLLAPWVIALFYGHSFAGADTILRVQIWAAIFVFLGVAREQLFLAEGWTKLSLATTVLGGIANLLLNLVMIPRWGGDGAAVATVISQFVAVYLTTFFFARTRPAGRAMTLSLFLPVRLLLQPCRLAVR